jgi:5'-methylthioadenosine phosphorylase
VVSDFIDLTRNRISTFFDSEVVAHVAMSTPVCPYLSIAASQAAEAAGANVHSKGTYVCIEGPQFSTRAESYLYRSWNVDVIGMTAMPEAKLAREAELPYSTLAFVTDYDCWNDAEASVSTDIVIAALKKNADLAPAVIRELIVRIPEPQASPAFDSLKSAIITKQNQPGAENNGRLEWLIGGLQPHGAGEVS